MREHNRRRHPAPESVQRRPCELFVPRVKESRLCSVCGFTLIDHNVQPIPYQPAPSSTGSLSARSKNSLVGLQHSRSVDGARDRIGIREFKLLNGLLIPQNIVHGSSEDYISKATMDSQLTPSFNSAFSRYERAPSKESIAISDFSLSPVSFQQSPYLHADTAQYPRHSRSSSITRMENLPPPPNVLKPKPLPMPRPYLRQQQQSLAPHAEDDRESYFDDFEVEPEPSPQMFRRIRHKKRDRSASSNGEKAGRASLSPIPSHQPAKTTFVPTQETVIRPPNFKEILNRFQAASDQPSPAQQPFQRHQSVRLPSSNQQNRRYTLGGDALKIDTRLQMRPQSPQFVKHHSPQLMPAPVIKLRTSTTNNHNNTTSIVTTSSPLTMTNPLHSDDSDLDHDKRAQANVVSVTMRENPKGVVHKREKQFVQRKESDAYQAALRARRAGLVGSLIEKKHGLLHDSDDDLRSSPDEDIVRKRGSVVSVASNPAPPPVKKRTSKSENSKPVNNSEGQYQATNAVAVRKPKPAHRSNSSLASGTQRKLSSHSILSNHSNASSLRNLKEIDENSNERQFNDGVHQNQPSIGSRPATAEYISGGSDSGYARYPNSAETSSLESPRSPSQVLRSPNPLRGKQAEDLYGQMTIQHTNTLAFMLDNYTDICKQHNEFSDYGRELFDEITVEHLIFKSSTPLLVKEKLVLFDAAYVSPNYTEHGVTVMLAPTCQYAPLMGRIGEKSGFGPPVLAEIEEPEIALRHLLDSAGIEIHQRSSFYRVILMPPLSVCSFHSLAAQNMHKAMNVQRYEHHVCFIMLQLLSALKVLQSDGVEHLSINFKEFLLTYKATDLKNTLEELHHLPKLMFLRETMEEELDYSDSQNRVGVCRYALRALCTLLNHKMNNVVPKILDRTEFSRPLRKCAELLHQDRSSSLTEAKNLLEFTFFCGRVNFEGEYEAKVWMDERRAHQVNRLVRLLADRSEFLSEPRERMYIQFLLSSTPRTLFNTFRQCNKL